MNASVSLEPVLLRRPIGGPLFSDLAGLLLLTILGAATAHAALFQGMIQEARYGMGVDSVQIHLAGSGAAVYSDAAGRFSFSPTALSSRTAATAMGRRPEVLWLARSKTIAWSGIRGTVSIHISDARGRVERRFESGPNQAGSFHAGGMAPGKARLRVDQTRIGPSS